MDRSPKFTNFKQQDDINFEYRFWLQILSDHMLFILDRTSADEKEILDRAKQLNRWLEGLLEVTRRGIDVQAEAKEATEQVIIFKKDILIRLLNGIIKTSLVPAFINHILNEAELFNMIQIKIANGEDIKQSSIQLLQFWTKDASEHIAFTITELDLSEKSKIKKYKKLLKQLSMDKDKADSFVEYYRTYGTSMKNVGLTNFVVDSQGKNIMFPAVEQLTKETALSFDFYFAMLTKLLDERRENQVLGIVSVLEIDHMIREEIYAAQKLNILPQYLANADPAAARITQ